jgi:HSP20 family protein
MVEELNDLMSGGFDRRGGNLAGTAFPRVDITESSEGYLLQADLPGMTREEIRVNVEDGVLSITGEKKSGFASANKDDYHHFERRYGRFMRSFSLPSNVDGANIEARYTNGVLEISLKKTEESKPKAIEIKVA